VHHTFGLLDGRYTIEQLRHKFVADESYSKRKDDIIAAHTLVIDEISMISAHLLGVIEALCR
jgi:hypothetical protein